MNMRDRGTGVDQAESSHDALAGTSERLASRTELASAWNHPVTAFARQNATALAAACVFSLVVLKILAVAQYNPRVAAALVGTAESPAVVLNVALYTAPLALAFLCALALALALNAHPARSDVAGAIQGAAVVTVFLCVVALPLLYLVTTTLLFGALPLRKRLVRNTRPRPEAENSNDVDAHRSWTAGARWAVTLALLPVFVVTSPPWMPAERVELIGGPLVVAYVVRSDADWTVLLVDRGRSLRYVHTAEISSREACSTDAYTSTLVEFFSGPQLPQCYP